MPKLSKAKRFKRQHNLAAFASGQDSPPLTKTPRKVSDEEIYQTNDYEKHRNQRCNSHLPALSAISWSSSCTSSSSSSSSCHDSGSSLCTPLSSPSYSSLQGKACLPRSSSSVRLSTWGTNNLTNSICAETTLRRERPPQLEQDTYRLEGEEDGSSSPIWGQFVDVIMEHEEDEGQPGWVIDTSSTTPTTPWRTSEPFLQRTFLEKFSTPPLQRATREYGHPFSPYNKALEDDRHSNNGSYYSSCYGRRGETAVRRQKIVSPAAARTREIGFSSLNHPTHPIPPIAMSPTRTTPTSCPKSQEQPPELLTDFVLLDPCTLLPEELARLKV